jgi:hypothetical protein
MKNVETMHLKNVLQQKYLFGLVKLRFGIINLRPDLSTMINRYRYHLELSIFNKPVFELHGLMHELPDKVNID